MIRTAALIFALLPFLGLGCGDSSHLVHRYERPSEVDLWVAGVPVEETDVVLELRGDRIYLAGIEMFVTPEPPSPTDADTTISPAFARVPWVREAVDRGVPASEAVRNFGRRMVSELEEAQRIRMAEGGEAALAFLRDSELVARVEGDSNDVGVTFRGMVGPIWVGLNTSGIDRPGPAGIPVTPEARFRDLESTLSIYLGSEGPGVLFLFPGGGLKYYGGEEARNHVRDVIRRTLEAGEVPPDHGRPSSSVLEQILQAAS